MDEGARAKRPLESLAYQDSVREHGPLLIGDPYPLTPRQKEAPLWCPGAASLSPRWTV